MGLVTVHRVARVQDPVGMAVTGARTSTQHVICRAAWSQGGDRVGGAFVAYQTATLPWRDADVLLGVGCAWGCGLGVVVVVGCVT